jgi:hypothetical protein
MSAGDFEKCRNAYNISKNKQEIKTRIKIWVKAERITPEEYEMITGEPYETEEI